MPAASSFPALPLVTIVALCHNHASFIAEALDSVAAQTYSNLEVWLVDDASTDGSQALLRQYADQHPDWHLLLLPENVGNCRAFNQAFFQSRGAFVIDFATDDVLLPERVARQVAFLQQQGPRCGMAYHDCALIDAQGRYLRNYYQRDAAGRIVKPVPASGEVFAEVLRRYFICTPSMMMRRETLLELGGYDETLAYEDFDFWVRASRNWEFHFQDELLTRRRRLAQSMSSRAYRPGDPYVASTIRTCRRALALCQTSDERAALATRLRWELRQAVRFRHRAEAWQLYDLLAQTGSVTLQDKALSVLSKLLK
ncbi:glycosyltransferase [Hymenobacter busanensis]|uniref:Glycosyltransferase n=1 Tax=Hymenobacter busanensis TaxID=2607656 RepID=A0A7L4ZU08_9BACT|nr:glycosyltransferase [Hymenobacter busanensis]KAA9339614.1 glycosyltransferase [Hymenobacter busanensis]QHJ06631.1 glycosyltransferase [Hymenobacter busanensis]